MEKLRITYECIDFQPTDLIFPKYKLIDTFGKEEAEEAMARLIEFSILENRWVAVSIDDFVQSVDKSIEMLKRANEIHMRNVKRKNAYEKECNRFKNKIKSLFGTKVPKPIYEKEIDVPLSILNNDPNAMVIGLRYLIANNHLEKFGIGNTFYLKPTQQAIERLKKFVDKKD